MGGSSKPSTQTTINKTEIPEEIRQRGTTITNAAMGQYMPSTYTAQNRNAPVNARYGDVAAGIDRQRTAFEPYQSRADSALTGAFQGNQAQGMGAPDFNQAAIDKFSNPYQQSVIDSTLADMERARQVARVADKGSAAAAGAFGGARHGVADAGTNSAYDRNMIGAVANLRSAGFDKAVGQYNQDFGQQLQARQLSNAAAGQNYGQGQSYATTLAGLGQQGAANEAAATQAAFGLANTEQGLAQQALDRNVEESRYAQDYPLSIYERLQAMNAMQPVNRTSTGTTTTTQPSNLLGTALYAAGSAAPMVASFMSDEATKENVTPLDPEATLGAFASIPTVSYDYKPQYAAGS